ncbi:MAG: hypothetical protein K8R92_02620 [Planctomycetes bacterium]|nr:hypothetical protein [Planctomycetota bacterium]
MQDPSMNQPSNTLRRQLLASIPAFLLAPAALAQQGVKPQGGPKAASTAIRDIPILPFALAGAWCDDFGARSILKMAPELSGAIVFTGQSTAYEEDQLRLLKVQVGAAVECVATLASASSCSFQSLYPQKAEPWFVKIVVKVSANGKPANARAVTACSGIWNRPAAGGAFDPAWNNKSAVDNTSSLMNEYGVSVKTLQDAKAAECAAALQAIAKASPQLAPKIGPASNWGPGVTPVLLGIATQDSTQALIAAGRSLQRGSLQAVAEGANCDSIVLPPKALEAAAVASKDAANAVKTLVKFLEGEAGEPIGIARIGKLLSPAFRPMPECVPMIVFSS